MVLFDTLCIITILAAVYYCYENGLHNTFTFDDHLAIVRNGDMDLNNPYINVWKNDLWGKNLQAVDSHKSYRPLLTSIFRILWSKSRDPFYFRLLSVGAHAVVSVLVYYLSLYVTKPPSTLDHSERRRNKLIRKIVSFGGALLFACHTVHVESVTAVVNLAEPLCGIFIILAYLTYSSSCQLSSHGSLSTISLRKHVLLVSLWFVLVTIAVLIKETAVVCCLMLLAHIAMLIGKQLISVLFHRKSVGSWKEWCVLWLWTFAALALLYVYFTMRSILVHPDRESMLSAPYTKLISYFSNYLWQMKDQPSYLNASQLIRKAENPFSFLTGQTRILSFMYLYYRYWELLFFPSVQSPEYTFNCIPAIESWEDPRIGYAVGSCAIVVLLFVLCIMKVILAWIRGEHLPRPSQTVSSSPLSSSSSPSPTPEVSFHFKTLLYLVFWFVISFFPISGIVFTLGTLLAERLLYIPSIASCIFFSLSLFRLIEWICVHGICTFHQRQRMLERQEQIFHPNQSSEVNGESATSSTLVYETVTTYTTICTKRTIVSFYTLAFQVVVYLLCMGGILWGFHIPRLRAYNVIWHNDESLFQHTVKICPTSAKANLQLSKIYSSKLDFVNSWKHLQASQRIDPDFCDTGYQEAILAFTKLSRSTSGTMEEDQDEEDWGYDWKRYQLRMNKTENTTTATSSSSSKLKSKPSSRSKVSSYETITPSMWTSLSTQEKQQVYDYHFQYIVEILLENLHCVYSNSQSLELLTKLWTHQLSPYQSLPSVHQITSQYKQLQVSDKPDSTLKVYRAQYLQKMGLLWKQGKLAYEHHIDVFGFPKLIECASVSFDLSDYQLALKCIDLAVKSVEQYEQQEQSDSSQATNALATSSGTGGAQDLSVFQCRIYALSGTMRAHVLQSLSAPSSTNIGTISSSEAMKLQDRYLSQKTILAHLLLATAPGKCLRLLSPSAVTNDPTSMVPRQILDHIKTANQYLLQYAQQSSKVPLFQRDFQEIFFYSHALTVAYLTEVHTKLLWDIVHPSSATKTKSSKKKSAKKQVQEAEKREFNPDEEKVLISTRQQLLQLYQYMSTYRYKQSDYPLASQYFLYALIFTATLPPLASSSTSVQAMIHHTITTVYTNPLGTSKKYDPKSPSTSPVTRHRVQDHVQVWKQYPEVFNITSQMQQRLSQNPQGLSDFFRLLYWYTDSLVGLPDFYDHVTNVQFVKTLLTSYQEGVKFIQNHSMELYETLIEHLPDVDTIESLITKFSRAECVMQGTCAPPTTEEVQANTTASSSSSAKKTMKKKKIVKERKGDSQKRTSEL